MYGELDEHELDRFRTMDEQAKWKRMIAVQKGEVGISKAQKDSLWVLQTTIDSANFVHLSGIISRYGFPAWIEEYKITTILIHADDKWLSDAFLATLKGEVMSGNLSALEYARLFDRVQYSRHLPERYLVNEHLQTDDGSDSPVMVIDVSEVNKARTEIGLKKYKAR